MSKGEADDPSVAWLTERHRRGMSVVAMAREWGCTPTVMRRAVVTAGLPVLPHGRVRARRPVADFAGRAPGLGSGGGDGLGRRRRPHTGLPDSADLDWVARHGRVPVPAAAPDGPLEVVAGLFVHRSAPFRPAVQRAVLLHLGGTSRVHACVWAGCSLREFTAATGRLATVPAAATVAAAADLLRQAVPLPVGEAAALLTAAGVVRGPDGVTLAVGLARVHGWPVPLVREVGELEWLLSDEQAQSVDRLNGLVDGWVRRDGLVPVDAAMRARPDLTRGLPDRLARRVVVGGRQVVGEPALLAVAGDRTSRLATVVDRMLVAAGHPLSIDEVVDGLDRALRRIGVHVPTRAQLLGWVRVQGAYGEDGSLVRLVGRPSARPRGLEEILVGVLRAAPDRRLPVSVLVAHASSAGYSANGLTPYLAGSPVVRPVRYGLHRLVGAAPRPQQVPAA